MIDTKRVGLWGCSAGGNLAASVALRDSAEHTSARIRHVDLVVPVTCHPSLYPDALESSSASMKRLTFGGSLLAAHQKKLMRVSENFGASFHHNCNASRANRR